MQKLTMRGLIVETAVVLSFIYAFNTVLPLLLSFAKLEITAALSFFFGFGAYYYAREPILQLFGASAY